jgi:hypothetical protein
MLPVERGPVRKEERDASRGRPVCPSLLQRPQSLTPTARNFHWQPEVPCEFVWSRCMAKSCGKRLSAVENDSQAASFVSSSMAIRSQLAHRRFASEWLRKPPANISSII